MRQITYTAKNFSEFDEDDWKNFEIYINKPQNYQVAETIIYDIYDEIKEVCTESIGSMGYDWSLKNIGFDGNRSTGEIYDLEYNPKHDNRESKQLSNGYEIKFESAGLNNSAHAYPLDMDVRDYIGSDYIIVLPDGDETYFEMYNMYDDDDLNETAQEYSIPSNIVNEIKSFVEEIYDKIQVSYNEFADDVDSTAGAYEAILDLEGKYFREYISKYEWWEIIFDENYNVIKIEY